MASAAEMHTEIELNSGRWRAWGSLAKPVPMKSEGKKPEAVVLRVSTRPRSTDINSSHCTQLGKENKTFHTPPDRLLPYSRDFLTVSSDDGTFSPSTVRNSLL